MSASPSGFSNGRTPTSNGGPPQFVRKPRAADPLVPRKRPARRPNIPPVSAVFKPNGSITQGRPVNGSLNSSAIGVNLVPANGAQKQTNGGWTQVPSGTFTDFPLVTTKRALREGLRYHIARFAAKKEIDPRNQDEFTRPVSLHRRDPHQPPPGKAVKDEELAADGPVDPKEQERLEILKAEKDARKAADLAQIAPTGNNMSALAAKKSQAFRNEKTTQVHRLDKTEEQKKESDLRYEEALPWHLEDADNKNTWVGNYEAALSETNVIFIIDGGCFKAIPIEKWYKFTPKNQFKTFTIEEAEAQLGKKVKESRWVMKSNETQEAGRAKLDTQKQLRNLFTVKAESNTFRNSGKNETQDMDDLDFAADDLFQDDDEQPTVEPDNDEETKEAQEKIKRDQLGANTFGEANEADIDKELDKEEKEAEKLKKLGKSLKKAIRKRERNYLYESDSDHPYSETSDDETSDEEKQKEIDRKKDEEAKLKAKTDSKVPSGTSSKGTNTPSGRPKHIDPLKKPKSLKRPGSPDLSESSGNESSRKKHKKKHHPSVNPTGTSTPIPGSGGASPISGGTMSHRKSSVIKLPVNPSKLSEIQAAPPNPSPVFSGHMSDAEATAGEMSDGGRKKKPRIRISESPPGSRAASPAPGRAGSMGASTSRPGSPAADNSLLVNTALWGKPRPGAGPIKPEEIVAAVPPSGISMAGLIKHFTGRVGDSKGQTDKKEFIRLVKENSSYSADKLLRPK